MGGGGGGVAEGGELGLEEGDAEVRFVVEVMAWGWLGCMCGYVEIACQRTE